MTPDKNTHPARFILSPSYRELEEELLRFVSETRAGAPREPVLVLVPSYGTAGRLGAVLGRGLRALPEAPPLPGADFKTAADLARTGASAPMARTPSLFAAARAAVDRLSETKFSERREAISNPSGTAAVLEAATDLLEAGFLPDILYEALKPLNRHERDTVEFAAVLLEGFLQALDEAALTTPELRMLQGAGGLPEKYSAFAVYGFYDLTKAQERLVETTFRAFSRAGKPAAAFVPATPSGMEYARRTLDFFRRTAGAPPVTSSAASRPATRLFHCGSEREEAAAAALLAARKVEEGIAPEEIVISARDMGPFLRPLASALERLGIPFRIASELPLSGTGPGSALFEAVSLCRQHGDSGDAPPPTLPLLGFISILSRAGSRRLPEIPRLKRALHTANALSFHELEQALSSGEVRARLGEAAPLLEGLRAEIRELFSAVGAFGEGRPGRLVEWLHRGFHPDSEGLGEAVRLVLEAHAAPGLPALWALEALSLRRTFRPGSPGQGVLVADLMSARNQPARFGILLGAREGLLPSSRREPPLLPFSIRDGLNEASGGRGYLPVRRLHLAEERMLLGLFLHNCGETACTFSPPAKGMAVKSTLLDEYDVEELPFREPDDAPRPLPRALKAGGLRHAEGLTSPRFLSHEGNMKRSPEAPAAARVSASFFNDFLACPFRAFLGHLLEIEPETEPGLDPVPPDVWGTAVHGMASEALREWTKGGRPSETELQRRIRETFDRLAEKGLVRRAAFLESRLERFIPRLAEWLLDYMPPAGAASECEVPLSFEEEGVTFTARLDRIDRTPSGTEITDYKTGSASEPASYHGQLFLYMFAAARAIRLPWREISARLVFFPFRSGSASEHRYDAPPWETAERGLALAAGAIKEGCFIKAPSSGCSRCVFLRFCHTRGEALLERKGASEEALRLREIRSVIAGGTGEDPGEGRKK